MPIHASQYRRLGVVLISSGVVGWVNAPLEAVHVSFACSRSAGDYDEREAVSGLLS